MWMPYSPSSKFTTSHHTTLLCGHPPHPTGSQHTTPASHPQHRCLPPLSHLLTLLSHLPYGHLPLSPHTLCLNVGEVHAPLALAMTPPTGDSPYPTQLSPSHQAVPLHKCPPHPSWARPPGARLSRCVHTRPFPPGCSPCSATTAYHHPHMHTLYVLRSI